MHTDPIVYTSCVEKMQAARRQFDLKSVKHKCLACFFFSSYFIIRKSNVRYRMAAWDFYVWVRRQLKAATPHIHKQRENIHAFWPLLAFSQRNQHLVDDLLLCCLVRINSLLFSLFSCSMFLHNLLSIKSPFHNGMNNSTCSECLLLDKVQF